MPKLRLTELTHRFGDTLAVDRLSLDVGAGEIVCLLGPSGCGKTTSLRLAAGLETLQTGAVEIDGVGVAGPGRALPPENRRIGMVFQDYALFPHLTVAANVGFGLTETAAAERDARVQAMLARVGLAPKAEAWPHELSGGEQQRVALARALAPAPDLMLMDEPFANLDVTLRNTVRDDTLTLLKSVGASVLLVTHDPEEAMRMADRIAVMQSGRIVQTGPPEEVYLKPASPFMARFFGPVNEFDCVIAGGEAATPFGGCATDLDDGPARLMIRPERLRLSAGGDAKLQEVRLIGAYWRVIVEMADGRLLKIRSPERPSPGRSDVTVTVAPEHMILFPVDR